MDHDVPVPDSADHSSLTEVALEYLTSVAPPDIADAISWLLGEGWSPATGRGGTHEAFGNVVVEFGKGGGAIRITRDRGIWEATLRLSGWQSSFGLGVILDARAGRTTWVPSDRNPYEVKQLPEGVQWTHALPEIVSWSAARPNAEALLDDCQKRRFAMLFPDLVPQSRPD
jgi:hypothetical protein